MLNFTPPTIGAGETPTSAKLNGLMATPWTDLQAPWTTWTPVLTAATTNPSVGAGSLEGWYTRIGKTVFFEWLITMGVGMTGGAGVWQVSAPVPPARNNRQTFPGALFDTSAAAVYPFFAFFSPTVPNLFNLRVLGATSQAAYVNFGSATLTTIASGDTLSCSGVYEAA